MEDKEAEMKEKLESRIDKLHNAQMDLIASLQVQVPDIVSEIDLSLKVISSFSGKPFTPLSKTPLPIPSKVPKISKTQIKSVERLKNEGVSQSLGVKDEIFKGLSKSNEVSGSGDGERLNLDGNVGGGRSFLSIVRCMVAGCLMERVPFTPIDSSTVLMKLENNVGGSEVEKVALRELGGEGGIGGVEMALRAIAEENGGVELEEFVVSGKSRVMVVEIDRGRLVKELPESKQIVVKSEGNTSQGQQTGVTGGGGGEFNNINNNNNGMFGMGPMGRTMPDVWMGPGDPHFQGMPPMFPGGGGPGGMMGPRGPRGMVNMMGVPPMHRPPMGPNGQFGGPSPTSMKPPRSEEDDLKDLEALLNKKSFKEMQKSKTGEELLDLIHRPTAKETAVAAKFKSKGGSQVKEYCSALTKEDCRRQSGSFFACEKVHFRRIIAPHTDVNLGDCSFLDTCRHMKTCKYVHYELDSTPDISQVMMGIPQKTLKPQRAEYCSEVELGESQWINCDIRNFRMDILGQYGVIMADPPWDIHMELPYGTMADDEMRTLNVPALQTDGLIFLWVTGRAMELGRECLDLWGYKRVEEIIWVKTNQLQRIIRTGRTGHWLNHSKEHCLVGIKGDPIVNRNIDTDVIVAEVRETSRKPDEMYPMLERISPRTRKLELFARMHNTHAGWMSLGNQLNGVRLVDEGLRARFKAAYPEVEVQPQSPPRPSAMEVDSTVPQPRNMSKGGESTSTSAQFAEERAQEAAYVPDKKPVNVDVEMTS
ncbi:N(6)-adenosine-methyltransferase MT-A70-like [Apium graveolens]|uniref:N(6)-adenosine-methyltransferase MT-A70-like n=1 Tax=Apium graveolens TaxID=4045 RepID=UPI003D793406